MNNFARPKSFKADARNTTNYVKAMKKVYAIRQKGYGNFVRGTEQTSVEFPATEKRLEVTMQKKNDALITEDYVTGEMRTGFLQSDYEIDAGLKDQIEEVLTTEIKPKKMNKKKIEPTDVANETSKKKNKQKKQNIADESTNEKQNTKKKKLKIGKKQQTDDLNGQIEEVLKVEITPKKMKNKKVKTTVVTNITTLVKNDDDNEAPEETSAEIPPEPIKTKKKNIQKKQNIDDESTKAEQKTGKKQKIDAKKRKINEKNEQNSLTQNGKKRKLSKDDVTDEIITKVLKQIKMVLKAEITPKIMKNKKTKTTFVTSITNLVQNDDDDEASEETSAKIAPDPIKPKKKNIHKKQNIVDKSTNKKQKTGKKQKINVKKQKNNKKLLL